MTERRKIVRHGPNTLTVSLPAKWARLHGLRKGDELTVEEREHALLVTPRRRRGSGITIDIRGRETLLPHLVSAAYALGHTDITIVHNTPPQNLHNILRRRCVGLEVVAQRQDVTRVRHVGDDGERDFGSIFRRALRLLIAMADDGLDTLRRGELDALGALVARGAHVRRLVAFCGKTLLAHGQRTYSSDCAMHEIVQRLGEVSRCYEGYYAGIVDGCVADNGAQARANGALHAFARLFFECTLDNAVLFRDACDAFFADRVTPALGAAVRELSSLMEAVLIVRMDHLTST